MPPLALLFCRPAAHEGVDSNMPPIGIPGSIDWPQGKADAYYFATIQMRQPSGVVYLSHMDTHDLPSFDFAIHCDAATSLAAVPACLCVFGFQSEAHKGAVFLVALTVKPWLLATSPDSWSVQL